MMIPRILLALGLVSVAATARAAGDAGGAGPASPLSFGETFTIESNVLGEVRRINVYRPPSYTDSATTPRPVLYMPDGGLAEDFLHIAGLLEVSVGNGTMRPFLLVGIENTQRRRDLTGPTQSADDKKIAPKVGGSAAFRSFIRSELMPVITARYPTTGETAIMGESLAGLFVVETLFTDPDMFDTYIAIDPSVWWNNADLVTRSGPLLPATASRQKILYLASSSDDTPEFTRKLAERLQKESSATLKCWFEPMKQEKHATIYHPAASLAVRKLFAPSPR